MGACWTRKNMTKKNCRISKTYNLDAENLLREIRHINSKMFYYRYKQFNLIESILINPYRMDKNLLRICTATIRRFYTRRISKLFRTSHRDLQTIAKTYWENSNNWRLLHTQKLLEAFQKENHNGLLTDFDAFWNHWMSGIVIYITASHWDS